MKILESMIGFDPDRTQGFLRIAARLLFLGPRKRLFSGHMFDLRPSLPDLYRIRKKAKAVAEKPGCFSSCSMARTCSRTVKVISNGCQRAEHIITPSGREKLAAHSPESPLEYRIK
ncbi:MAG: hypothetical protein LUD68_03545 [Rikenellaceae bacterium]|nr:hypothetical protein [Rikenellaceae bacterium]